MIKFVLHGGNMKECLVENKIFFNEITSGFDKKVKILLVPFALEKKYWQDSYIKYTERFKTYIVNLSFEMILASENEDDFLSQIKSSDIIFFCGGNENLIKEHITNVNRLYDCFSDKVIVGTSAGANIFSTCYYSNDRNLIESGFGFLNIKTICHFSKEKNNDKFEILRKSNKEKGIKAYALEEGQFISLYKE